MPRVPVNNVGLLGIVQDMPPHTLPPEAWNNGRNVRFRDNRVQRIDGHRKVFDPPSVTPYWALGCPTPTDYFWLYASLTKVYGYSAGSHGNITRQTAAVDVDYAATPELNWNGGLLGGIPIITNGVDAPQFWADISLGTKLADLTNWPASTTAKIIRPFGSFLVALYITKSGAVKPHMVKWSHPADPGTLPSSWDETDPTKDAGENDLSDTIAGVIQDGLGLRNMFIIYKDNSTWGMQFVGGQFVFRFFPILSQSGILSTHCVTLMPDGTRHFVATGDDIITFNGQNPQSILTDRGHKALLNDIDKTNFNRSFVTANARDREMWFCYPETGATWPTKVIVWNYEENTITIRDISNISFIAQGLISETVSNTTWDSDSEPWDGDMTQWGTQQYAAGVNRMLGCDPVNTKFYQMGDTFQFNGTDYSSFIERTGIALVGQDRQKRPIVDFSSRKLAVRIWPKATGASFNVRVGAQETLDAPITWSNAVSFNPGTDQYVDVCVAGRLLAIRFESASGDGWSLYGYDVELERLGVF